MNVSRRRYMGEKGRSISYQRIEYLKSVDNKVQYIDSGITPSDGHAYVFDFAYMSFDGNRKIIIGNYNADNTVNATCIEVYTNNQLRLYEKYLAYPAYDKKSAVLAINKIIYVNAELDFVNKEFYAEWRDDTSQGTVGVGDTVQNIGTNTYSLKLFHDARYPGGTIAHTWAIYYFKIFDNGILVRDFIPVRIGTTGYMYDTVSGELFGNLGTGNFILGPDIN